MAFTGTPAIHYVSDKCVRITGLSLALGGTTGTIALSQGTGEVEVVRPKWNRYTYNGVTIDLDSSIKCTVVNAVADPTTTEPITVVKTGNGPTDFLITLQNNDAANSGELEIWLEFMA